MSRLALPQLEVVFDRDVDVRQVLVLGGRAPDVSWLRKAASDRIVWAADSGVEACRAANVRPDHVLGDFDSIGEGGRRWLEDLGIEPLLYPTDKDYTDFQLCLSRMNGDLLVTGCWGKRFDHAFGNIFSSLWGDERGARVRAFADESEIMVLAPGGSALDLFFHSPAGALSLLPLTAGCGGVSIENVKWELHDAKLRQAHPFAISNLPIGDPVRLRIEEGVLGVYCLFGGLLDENLQKQQRLHDDSRRGVRRSKPHRA
ncbi:MAG: thiamine diphosphokinase [Synergistaceae bacterium]|jgi:thiamine pyrophosphokinase|nr:thiamine diphosphokinase [Synergistaceae bacterium]